MMRRVDLLELATAEPGVYAVRSASDTVYLVDTRAEHLMMRLTGPRTHSRGWWDNTWVPLVAVSSSPDGEAVEPGVLRAGCRAKYLADPGGLTDKNHHFWLSRVVTRIDRLSDDDVAYVDELLAQRHHEEVAAATDEVLEKRSALLARLRDA